MKRNLKCVEGLDGDMSSSDKPLALDSTMIRSRRNTQVMFSPAFSTTKRKRAEIIDVKKKCLPDTNPCLAPLTRAPPHKRGCLQNMPNAYVPSNKYKPPKMTPSFFGFKRLSPSPTQISAMDMIMDEEKLQQDTTLPTKFAIDPVTLSSEWCFDHFKSLGEAGFRGMHTDCM